MQYCLEANLGLQAIANAAEGVAGSIAQKLTTLMLIVGTNPTKIEEVTLMRPFHGNL